LPQIKAGKLRALAITGDQRIEELPDVPTLKELGLGECAAVVSIQMVLAPKGTPRNVRETLEEAFREASKSKAVATVLKTGHLTGLDVWGDDSNRSISALSDHVKEQFENLGIDTKE
jgi:tripartite-type tricarboxylate transporter receptor subunit TctC